VRLSRTRVVNAALELMEQDAENPISMEALATHLGCSLLVLYGCVPSTTALLDSVARAALSGLPVESPSAGKAWTDQVAAHVRLFRQAASAHSRGVAFAASRPPRPLPPGWPLEPTVAALQVSGLSEADSVRAARAIGWYVFGSVLAHGLDDADADFDFGLALLLSGAAALGAA
jgi:TetR/AcrR family transcriptional regulator, tetracycline repressor protein